MNNVRDILEAAETGPMELMKNFKMDVYAKEVFVFTPKGEQKSIQKGATALDFAYLIHSEIGHKAIAAKVNMKLVPLSYVLKSGDQVEIITAQNESPKGEWLNFLQTRRAKNTVLDYLKDERNQFITEGKRQIVDKLSSMGLKLNTDTLASLMNGYEIFGTEEELYLRVGLGILDLNTIQDIIGNNPEKSKGWNFNWFKSNSSKNGLEKQDSYIISDSLETKRKYVFAHCCHPIPGDSVVGFLSSDGVITVHKKSCNVANSIAAKHGDRIVKAEWDVEKRAFLVRLSLKGFDKMGMINEITSKISNEMNVNIRKFVISSDAGIFEGYVDLYDHDKNILDKLIKSISKINGIQNVLRTDL